MSRVERRIETARGKRRPINLSEAVLVLSRGGRICHVCHSPILSGCWINGVKVSRGGTVKLRPQLAEYADDEPVAQLPRISFSTRDHQPRCLALQPLLPEFP